MTDQEIRIKLINKLYPDRKIESFDTDNPEIYYYGGTGIGIMNLDYNTIFSHEFAKTFWGEEPIAITNGKPTVFGSIDAIMPKFVYHLQQMVLEEDPIKYLEKFL